MAVKAVWFMYFGFQKTFWKIHHQTLSKIMIISQINSSLKDGGQICQKNEGIDLKVLQRLLNPCGIC